MINIKAVIIILTYWFCSISSASAYLDPGTGSIILQTILAFIAAIGATLSLYWTKFKIFIKKIFKKDNKNSKTLND